MPPIETCTYFFMPGPPPATGQLTFTREQRDEGKEVIVGKGKCQRDVADCWEVYLEFAHAKSSESPTLVGTYVFTYPEPDESPEKGALIARFHIDQWQLFPRDYQNRETWYLKKSPPEA